MAVPLRRMQRAGSGSYAEKLYKRSSFYRSWSGSQGSSRSSISSSVEEETLLAKALYDNLADAPDELSFRKGDVVTVIEKDVDGIVGWWLCLLHGRQGIAPGNRLQIIAPFETNNTFRNAGSQGSLSADDLSDSFDANLSDSVTQGPEYDTLPAPVKATHGQLYDYPSPRNIKDVLNNADNKPAGPKSHPNYATPKGITASQDYDVVPSRKNAGLSPAELYDIPQPVRTQGPEQLYDFPTRKPVIQQQKDATPSPKLGRTDFQNALSAFTSIPEPNQDLYDTPKSLKAGEEIYDIPPSSILSKGVNASRNTSVPGGMSEIYDVPPAVKKNSVDDTYDVPPSVVDFRNAVTPGSEIYDVPPAVNNNLKNQLNSTSREIYDHPRRQPQDIYDYPPPSSQAHNGQSSNDDIYDLPPQDIYDVPPRGGASQEDIYDHPPPSSQNEIYDHPPSSSQDDIYDHPPARSHINGSSQQQDDIYDQPTPSSNEIYDEPPPSAPNRAALARQDEIYDHPPNRAAVDATTHADNHNNGTQDIYDVPTHHDIGKVMSDISHYQTTQSIIKPYTRHRRERNNNTSTVSLNKRRVSEDDDDDYVDYQDIYGKEPPAEMVKEMEKTTESPARSLPSKAIRKHSSFEQINMEAVKELKITQKQAFERLNKLHLAVDTSVTTLVSHTSGEWLEPNKLANHIDAIKDMSSKVKLSLRLLTEFGLGAVVNAKVVDGSGKMVEDIKVDLEPLLECYYKMKVCILHLDGCKWKVPSIRDKETEKFFATVNAIMILGSRVPEACRKLTGTLHYCVKSLFAEDPAPVMENANKSLMERMENLRLKSQRSRSPERSRSPDGLSTEKGKLKPVPKTVDAKKVREILELDTRPKWNWAECDGLPDEKPEGVDMSPIEMKKEFQNRRQKGYNSTLPRRPPVPPKPTLPSNRRSMAAATVSGDDLKTTESPSKVDTLVTDFIAEDGRKKYASDPTQSPMEPEPARKPEWGGSCPELDDRSSYSGQQLMGRATSSGTAASTTSTYSSNHDSMDDADTTDSGLNKMSSDTHLYSPQTLVTPRAKASPSPTHLRSASLPWDNNKIPFASYEKEQRSSPKHLAKQQEKRLSKLDHRDSEALTFFLQRVESQVLILREAVRNLTESIANNETPQVFVSHSKFVILTAHKVVHAGEELVTKLMNSDVKFQVKRASSHLADSIRGVVAGTKQAALDYPNQNSLMEMMTTVLSVGEAVREVHKEAKKGLEM
eukprot:gene18937-20842_t